MGTVVLHTRGSITMGLFNKTTTSRLNSVNQRHIPTDRSPCRKSNQHQPAARLGLSSRVSDWIWGYGGHINREQPCVDELVARSAVPAFLALAAYLVGPPCWEQPCVDELVARSAVPAFLALAAYLVGPPCWEQPCVDELIARSAVPAFLALAAYLVGPPCWEQPCVDELVARSAVPAFLALAAYLVGSPCCLTPRHCRKERRCKPNDPCMACSSDLVHMTRSLDHLSYEILTTTNL
jgi:hypothetical protein